MVEDMEKLELANTVEPAKSDTPRDQENVSNCTSIFVGCHRMSENSGDGYM